MSEQVSATITKIFCRGEEVHVCDDMPEGFWIEVMRMVGNVVYDARLNSVLSKHEEAIQPNERINFCPFCGAKLSEKEN